nr:major capsid protein [uncultured Duganella sp.]
MPQASNPFIYDTNALIQTVPNLKVSQQFLLDRFFGNIVISDTEFVSIDVDIGKRRMSPFVSPLVEGKLVEQRRIQTNQFKPAYIKDKRAPDLRKPVRRMIGERIGGALTGADREAANLEMELTDQLDMLNRRLEWMAASALVGGTVTIAGDGFPTVVVDFGRDASLSIAKSGTGRWTAANIAAGTASPSSDVENWTQQMLKKSGAVTTDVVFSTSAWQGFKLDPALQGAIIYPKMSDNGNNINPGAQIKLGAQYKGRWGNLDLWVYNDWFVDDNNVEQPMIPDGSVTLVSDQLQGVRAFGMIEDPEFNYEALAYAPKTWVEKDPAQRILLMQAAPIVIPSRPNASMSAQVL